MTEVCVGHSVDVATTHALAARLAERLSPGDAVSLRGDLGAGKTTFVAGLLATWGSPDDVLSPTFTLENRYRTGPGQTIPEVLHLDLYRFDDEVDPQLLGSMDEARSEGAVVLVEWGDRLETGLEPYLDLEIALVAGADAAPVRRLTLRPVPADGPGLDLAGLAGDWAREGSSWA